MSNCACNSFSIELSKSKRLLAIASTSLNSKPNALAATAASPNFSPLPPKESCIPSDTDSTSSKAILEEIAEPANLFALSAPASNCC